MSARLAILGGTEGKPGEWNAVWRALLARQAWESFRRGAPSHSLPPLLQQRAGPWSALPTSRTQGAQEGHVWEDMSQILVAHR